MSKAFELWLESKIKNVDEIIELRQGNQMPIFNIVVRTVLKQVLEVYRMFENAGKS